MSDTKPVKAPTQAALRNAEDTLRQLLAWMQAQDSEVVRVEVGIDDEVRITWYQGDWQYDTEVTGSTLNAAVLLAQYELAGLTPGDIPPF